MALQAFSSLSAGSKRSHPTAEIDYVTGAAVEVNRNGAAQRYAGHFEHAHKGTPRRTPIALIGGGRGGGGGPPVIKATPTFPSPQAHFCSSSSQTTFLDRNIVQNLAVAAAAPLSAYNSTSKLSGNTATTATNTAQGHAPFHDTGASNGVSRRRRPRTVPASYTSGSGSVKRASFSGTLPDGKQYNVTVNNGNTAGFLFARH